mmetsp:Transcript_26474/g.61503  ORF Transcript_26474/g.61503 Transcript_26474/m.61503 type:complete len:372 (+) Transcript_26474:757-1872(+)
MHLHALPVTEWPGKVVLSCGGLALGIRNFFPGDFLQLLPPERNEVPVARHSDLVLRHVDARPAVQKPLMAWARAQRPNRYCLFGSLCHVRIDPPFRIGILQEIERLPAIFTQRDFEGPATGLCRNHLLWDPARPGSHDLIAVRIPIGLQSHLPLDRLAEHDLLIRVIPVGHFCKLLIARILPIAEGHGILDRLELLLLAARQGLWLLFWTLQHGAKAFAGRSLLRLVHRQGQAGIHGSRRKTTSMIEAATKLINLHKVVHVFLVLPDRDFGVPPPLRRVIKFHPRLAVDLVERNGVGRRHLDGVAVELQLPDLHGIKKWHIVHPHLVHAGCAAGAVGEDQDDLSKGLLHLVHDDGRSVEEGRDRVAWADDL